MTKKTKSTIKKTLNTNIPFSNTEISHLVNATAGNSLIIRAGEYKKTIHFHDLVELSQVRGNIEHPRYNEYIEWRTTWNYTKWEKLNALRFEDTSPKPEVKGPHIHHRDIGKEQQEQQEEDERLYEEIERLQSQLRGKRKTNGPLPQFGIT